MQALKLIIIILLVILIASFAVENMGSVSIKYYDTSLEVQSMDVLLIWVVGIPFVLGFLLGGSWGILRRIKLRTTVKGQDRTISSLQDNLERLNSRPESAKTAEMVASGE